MSCAHTMCSCEVTADQEYCSDFCRNPNQVEMGSRTDCGCGHDACTAMGMGMG
jgi:hypothetical protein